MVHWFENCPSAQLPPAVYYIPAGKAAIRVAEDIERPNGVQLNPDETVLYVSNTDGEFLLAFEIQPDGTLRNRRNFARHQQIRRSQGRVRSGADGIAIDKVGRVYVATAAGIEVFGPQGELLGIIPLSRAPQNLAFAGRGKRTLYAVGRGAAFKVEMLAQGFQGRAK